MTAPREALQALDTVLATLDLEETRAVWVDGWAESYAGYAPAGASFLEAASIDEQCRALDMDHRVRAGILNGLALFTRRPALKRLAWHCYHTLFLREPLPSARPFPWPALPATLDEAAPLFYVYVYLAGVPHVLAHHRRRAIPRAVSLDTLSDLPLWIKDYHDKHGVWGFAEQGWLRHHFAGRLYQLGRLQFEQSRYAFDYHAFRNRHDGRILVLAGAGMRFRRDGLRDGTNGIYDAHAWTASFDVTDTAIIGHLIHPRSVARRDPITLPVERWQEILKQGDPTLGVHIPATGPMDFDQCGAAFERALPFFQQHVPEHPVHAFTCSSWLLDPQLEEHLSPTTNIVRFLREWYLVPEPDADDAQTIARVFGAPGPTLDAWPRKTSLQRAIVRHLKRGGRWRMGAGLIFPDRLAWGRQAYR